MRRQPMTTLSDCFEVIRLLSKDPLGKELLSDPWTQSYKHVFSVIYATLEFELPVLVEIGYNDLKWTINMFELCL